MQRGSEFSIMSGSVELMNSRLSGSEEALATLAAERIGGRARARILIGGLGMGFTLRATLAAFGPDAQIVVAELVPAVVAWARGPMAHITDGCLDDPRVSIRERDVSGLIASPEAPIDAILLDVDNGPGGLSRPENDRLYSKAGLRTALAALTPGGLLAVWSSGPNAEFARRLAGNGFNVEEVKVRATKSGRGARHVIWIGTRPSPT